MKDEQMEVWFESIESQLKEISRKQCNDNSEVFEKTKLLFDDFISKIRGLKLNMPTQDFSPIEQKVDSVLDEAKRISQPIMAAQIKTEHYFLFFPDLKQWLYLLNRAKFIWLLAILLVGSGSVNWHLWTNYQRYQTSDLKMRYIRYKGSVSLVATLHNLDSAWMVPKFKTDALKSIERYELTILKEKQKQERKMELEKELKNLNTNP